MIVIWSSNYHPYLLLNAQFRFSLSVPQSGTILSPARLPLPLRTAPFPLPRPPRHFWLSVCVHMCPIGQRYPKYPKMHREVLRNKNYPVQKFKSTEVGES